MSVPTEPPAPVETDTDPGMRCPNCASAWSHVTHSRPLPSGRIRRYRVCHHCQTKFTTLELSLGEASQGVGHGNGTGNGKRWQ